MVAYYNEIDPYAAQWLRNLIAAGHIAPGDVDDRSIKEVKASDLKGYTQCHFFAGIGVWSYALRQAGWADDRPVWTGSCPCTPFSVAGKGKGKEDERHLWPDFYRLIHECRPDIVIGEQVSSPDGLTWFDDVSNHLEDEGYAVGALDTCAAGIGAPHLRQRLYWVGHTDPNERIREQVPVQPGRQDEAGLDLVRASGFNRSTLGNPDNARSGRDTGAILGAQAESSGEREEPGGVFDSVEFASSDRSPVAHTHDQRPQVGSGQAIGRGVVRIEGEATVSRGPVNGFWAGAEWIPCRDGKHRPIEPGIAALATRTPGRVGRIRAYGNALVAPQATAFIRAYLET